MTQSTQGSTPAVRARGLTKMFADGVGVHDLSLDVEAGTIFGFIGPSGSGKTTTIRLMTGILRPDSGELSVLGKAPAAFDRADRSRLGYMPQLSVLYPHLSIWENLAFTTSLFGVPWRGRRRLMKEQLQLVELDSARTRLLRDSSGGMQRRLALAATLIHSPDLLFLDEPTAGIDPILRKKFWDHFVDLRDQGRTLFVTTQYVGEAAYCDRVGVLAEGRLIAVDTPEGLRRQAFGGEVLDVVFAQPLLAPQLDQLAEIVSATRVERIGIGEVRLVVADAGEASPQVTAWASEAGVEIESVEPYLPAFDDVFVELITKLTASRDSNEAAA
ncbi:MAG TPA: ABC transporter ATP-binding protein [Acidimicrobiia bacterium]|nr:ABC transporter ATP-binding protein [Acidimicrobiia bacterium]